MKEFIIVGLILSATVGFFFSLMFVSLTNLKVIPKVILVTIVSLIIGFSLCGLVETQKKMDEKKWNGGYCTECGNDWELVSVYTSGGKTNSTKYYVWKCDKCENFIEITSKFEKHY